jgi:MoaA/NifB/PqqE/SkfB family radical SAM enzyme
LRELDVTGGEPFLRDDLVRMVEGLLEEKRGNLRRLRSIAITTNGFLPERILSFTRGVIGRMEEAGLELVLAFSLDGVGELHGRIRRFPNAWERLMESIEGAKHIRERHRNLILGVKTTILPLNVRHLDAILDFTRQHGLFMILSPFIRTENRYENTDLMLGFSEEELGLMRQFLEQREIKWDFHRTMLISFLKTGRVKKPCSAGFNYFFIRANGDVYPCPLVKRSIGNFLLTPFGAILRSKALRTFRLDVGRLAECRTCTEPGLERYALPFEGFHCLRYLVGQGRRSFVELFNHMGLNKYL